MTVTLRPSGLVLALVRSAVGESLSDLLRCGDLCARAQCPAGVVVLYRVYGHASRFTLQE